MLELPRIALDWARGRDFPPKTGVRNSEGSLPHPRTSSARISRGASSHTLGEVCPFEADCFESALRASIGWPCKRERPFGCEAIDRDYPVIAENTTLFYCPTRRFCKILCEKRLRYWGGWTRTINFLINSQAVCQLTYAPSVVSQTKRPASVSGGPRLCSTNAR